MNSQHGFTLVESLVTLSVLGTLVGVGVTTLGDLVRGVQLQALANTLHQQLLLARSEAIRRNARVALCKSADGVSCTTAGGWEQGGILFVDRNRSGSRDPQEPVLQQLPALPRGWRISASGPVSAYVSYGPLGAAQLSSRAFQAGTFTLCPTSADAVDGLQVIINAGGRTRVQRTRLDNCF
jgi:type IV fimbrial biogenesis protein FimT